MNGLAALLALLSGGVSAAVLVPARSHAVLRVASLLPSAPRVGAPRGTAAPGAVPPRHQRAARALGAAGVGAAVVLLLGGLLGTLLAVPAVVWAYRLLARQEPGEARRVRAAEADAIPLVAELLAAAVQAGAPTSAAVTAVATAVGGPAGDRLRTVLATAQLAADPAQAWRDATAGTVLGGVGACLARSQAGGGAAAHALTALAEDCRETARWTAQERARSVGARAAVPLGLCFLPAFVLVGVVPLVAGSVRDVLP